MSDLGAVFDEHVRSEFETRDIDATMATMTTDPYVYHVPTMAGGVGRDDVRAFYSGYFIGHWPQDTNITPISRTSGETQVVDELVVSFTHDIEMEVFLPGVAPTGRKVELAIVVVVAFEDGKVSHEHIYWDQASLLVQAGLLDPSAVPAVGAEQSRWLVDRSPPLNALLPVAARGELRRSTEAKG